MRFSMMWGGFVQHLELFDAQVFRISPEEASAMNPQHWLLLEANYVALDDARHSRPSVQGTSTGVFISISSWGATRLNRNLKVYSIPRSILSTAARQISFVFGLQVPCSVYDTACSAICSLQGQVCNLTVVGVVNAMLTSHT